MPFSEIIYIILPTFITILIGYAIGKTIKIEVNGIVDVVFYVGLPAIAFVSILNQEIVLIDAVKVWVAASIVMLGCGAIGWVIFKLKKEKHSGLYLPIALPNTVNIPFPIISLAYGPAGLFTATLYYIPNVILLYSLGVFVAAGKSWKENLKAALKVPAVYSAVLALILNIYNVSVPALMVQTLDFISSMVIPAVLFTLGYSLASIKVTSLPTTFLSSLIRVGGGLGLGFLVAYLFNLTGIDRSVVILMSAMPAAVNTYLLAAKYKNEAELVASVVLVTTVASLLMVPLLLNVLG